jgi:hypothetical protein
MPGFVKTPKDEAKWSKAKEAAGKSTSKGSKGYWALSNYIFHKMGKSEDSAKMAKMFKNELQKQGLVKISGVQKLHEFLTNRKRG